MTDLETKIIETVLDCQGLSENEKAKVLAAMALMTPKNQKELLEKTDAFAEQVKKAKKGEAPLKAVQAGALKTVFGNLLETLNLKSKPS